MKKLMAIIMCAAISATLIACSGGNTSKNGSTASGNSSAVGSNASKTGSSKTGSSKSDGTGSANGSASSDKGNTSGTASSSKTASSASADTSSMNLTKMLEDICKDSNAPANDIFDLDKSNFESYSFIPWTDGIEAACSEGQITTDAHSLVLIRVKDVDAKTIAESIADKADTRKWICVGAEVGKVLYTDKYVLMAMTYERSYDTIKANFEKLVGAGEVKSLDIKSADKWKE